LKPSRLLRGMAVLLALLLISVPARATGQIYFTVINNNLLPLTSDTMPTWFSGTLYVPYHVFDDNTSGAAMWMGLGTHASYSVSNETVSIYNLDRMLVFDLEEDTCYDPHNGQTYLSPAITRNGLPYVPVGQVCSFFDLTYSYLTNLEQGILVRIKSSGPWMTDATFINSSKDYLNLRLQEYNQSQTYMPAPPNPASPPEQESPENIPLYLGIRCQGGGSAGGLADVLDAQRVKGLFFFTPELLREQDDLARRLLSTGHSVGLLLSGETPEESREQLDRGGAFLREIACVRPAALLCPDGQRAEFQQDGWVCWQETAAARPESPAQQASALQSQEQVRLTLEDSPEMAAAANALLNQLKNRQFDIRLPMETRL